MGKKVDPSGYHPLPRRQAAIDLDQLRDCYAAMGRRGEAILSPDEHGTATQFGLMRPGERSLFVSSSTTEDPEHGSRARGQLWRLRRRRPSREFWWLAVTLAHSDELVTNDMEDRLSDTRLGRGRHPAKGPARVRPDAMCGATAVSRKTNRSTDCHAFTPQDQDGERLPARNSRLSNDEVLGRLRRHLEFLGLTQTGRMLDEHLAWATEHRPGHTALLEHVLSAEVAFKSESRIENRIRNSGLRERKTLEAFDFDFQPKLDRSFIVELARLDFVRRRDDVVITGKSGTGKSHILKAFGLRACQQGVRVRYARCVDLIDDLHAGSPTAHFRGACARGARLRCSSLTTWDSAKSASVMTNPPVPTRSSTSST